MMRTLLRNANAVQDALTDYVSTEWHRRPNGKWPLRTAAALAMLGFSILGTPGNPRFALEFPPGPATDEIIRLCCRLGLGMLALAVPFAWTGYIVRAMSFIPGTPMIATSPAAQKRQAEG